MERMDRAVILAAGMGSRLKWMTREQPKALINVGGSPAILRVIRGLVRQGIREIAVNAFHHADQLADYLGDGAKFGCHIRISYEDALLDSGGGVKKALQELPGSGAVLVHNCDVLANIDVARLAHRAAAGACALAMVKNPAHHPLGDFSLKAGHVSMKGYDRFTFSGVSVWDSAIFDAYEAGEAFSLARCIREQIAKGTCTGLLHAGYWFDIGRPGDLMQAGRSLGKAT